MKKLFLLTTVLFLIGGCATTYQANSFSGGFTETQLDTNVFTVRFNGNGYTSKAKASDFALLRSAELTLNNGYKYFVIIDSKSYTKKTQGSIPQTNYNYGTVSGTGGTASYSGYSTSYQNFTVRKPRAENTILMLKDKPEQGMSYKAEFIVNSLKSSYGLE